MQRLSKKIELARSYAAKAHEGQLYGDEFPYFIHVWHAFLIALRFGVGDEDLLCAILLHDVKEDANKTDEDIIAFFGARVAYIVDLLTEPSGTRKERHAYSHPRIAKDFRARIAKLCDRLAHWEFGGKKLGMYRKEHPAFKSDFGESLSEIETAMWEYLDELVINNTPSLGDELVSSGSKS